MAGLPYTSQSSPQQHKAFNGGLNSTAGSLELKDNESSDLQNVDFDKFGSILKRNGYFYLNPTPITDGSSPFLNITYLGTGGLDDMGVSGLYDGVGFGEDPVTLIFTIDGEDGGEDTVTVQVNDYLTNNVSSVLSNNSTISSIVASNPTSGINFTWGATTGHAFNDSLINNPDFIETGGNLNDITVTGSYNGLRGYPFDYIVQVVGLNGVNEFTISNAGTGYEVFDIIGLDGGNNDFVAMVNSVGGGGQITGITLNSNFDPSIYPGSNYTLSTFDVTGGSGSGAQFDIDSLQDVVNVNARAGAQGTNLNMGMVTGPTGSGPAETDDGLNFEWASPTGHALTTEIDTELFNYWAGAIVSDSWQVDAFSGSGSGDPGPSDGLYWFEFSSGGDFTRKLVNVSLGKLWKMDDLDGTWDDVTGSVLINAGNHCDFETFLNKVIITNGVNPPFLWAGTGTASLMAVPVGLTRAKYVRQFNNYLFLANVTVDGTHYPSRFYWSRIKDIDNWDGDQFIEVSKDDGQEITGIKVLQDRLVIYKTRAIYNLFFTGDADFPFILPGGGKSNSTVGCISPFSIQEIENGHVFLAVDGLYYYDGMNSTKLSYRVQKTLDDDLNQSEFPTAVSCVFKPKNKYLLALSSEGQSTHNRVLVWDYYNNAFSVYTGIAASAMANVFLDGTIEQIYFCDYDGFTYQMETGVDDYPLKIQTAIDFFYWTNWKYYDDLCDQKGVPNIYIYYQSANTVLTLAYSYDFESGEQYSQTFSLSGGVALYDVAIWDDARYASAGGAVRRRDLTGRGRVVRFKFANANLTETVQIDGLGTYIHLETNV